MKILHFSLFGKFKIACSDQVDIGLEARRARELLAYLLLYRQQPHEREKLSTLLWGDRNPTRARQYLRQTLWQIQSALHPSFVTEPILLAEHDCIGVNPQAHFWLDVACFDQAYAIVENIPSSDLSESQRDLLQETVQLYHGDLVEGWYEDWCIYERERYQSIYLALLDKLVGYSETHGDYKAGMVYAMQSLRYDRARERTHRALMRLHVLAGNRTAALHQYELCAAALAEELSVAPSKRTIALYEQIRAERFTPPAPSWVPPQHNTHNGQSATELALQQLHAIQTTMVQLQSQITQLADLIEHD